MKLAIKLPLIAFLCLLGAEATASRQALAGVAPVVIPDSSASGLGDTFSNPGASRKNKLSCDNNGVVNTLRDIKQSESVSSVNGEELSIAPNQINSIESLLSDRPTNAELDGLAQQVANETGVDVEISRLDLSSNDLRNAISSANELVSALDGEQLAAAADSPALMALLQLLKGGNASMPGLDSLGGECETGLLKVALAPIPAAVPAPAEPLPPTRTQQSIPEPEPEPVTTFQEPVRGLW